MDKQTKILQHIKDIDFRTKEARQEHAVDDFKDWYNDLQAHQSIAYSETTQAQLSLLSSVLWYLMPHKEYKIFMKQNTTL